MSQQEEGKLMAEQVGRERAKLRQKLYEMPEADKKPPSKWPQAQPIAGRRQELQQAQWKERRQDLRGMSLILHAPSASRILLPAPSFSRILTKVSSAQGFTSSWSLQARRYCRVSTIRTAIRCPG